MNNKRHLHLAAISHTTDRKLDITLASHVQVRNCYSELCIRHSKPSPFASFPVMLAAKHVDDMFDCSVCRLENSVLIMISIITKVSLKSIIMNICPGSFLSGTMRALSCCGEEKWYNQKDTQHQQQGDPNRTTKHVLLLAL